MREIGCEFNEAKFVRVSLRHKLRGTSLTGYSHETKIRGRTLDLFVYRDRHGWVVLHYPSGLEMLAHGTVVCRPTRKAAIKALVVYLYSNASDYLLDCATRSPTPERCFGWPYEVAA